MQSKNKAYSNPTTAEHQRAEAAKTTRLRALRLAKEAEDRETAARLAAAAPPKSAKRRVRAAPADREAGPA